MARSDNKYAVYLTIYKGNKLPPFYIGYARYDRLKCGYHGSVSSKQYKQIWKNELFYNPNLFVTKIIRYFDNPKCAALYEETIQRKFNVHKNPMYINMSISGKAYNTYGPMLKETKNKISMSNKGRKFSNEHKRKLSESHKGQKAWNKGIPATDRVKNALLKASTGRIVSKETREKLSQQAKIQWKRRKELAHVEK